MTGLPLVTCPACHVEAGLEVFLGADDAGGVVKQMARCPGPPVLRKALLRYVGLHAPAQRRLTWARGEKLLTELVDMIEAGRIERNGRTWPAPLDYWSQALDTLFAMPALRRPLKGHGLLLEIIAGLSDKAEARQEQQRLTQARGETPARLPSPVGGGTLEGIKARGEGKPAPPAKPTHNRAAAAAALEAMKSTLDKGA